MRRAGGNCAAMAATEEEEEEESRAPFLRLVPVAVAMAERKEIALLGIIKAKHWPSPQSPHAAVSSLYIFALALALALALARAGGSCSGGDSFPYSLYRF